MNKEEKKEYIQNIFQLVLTGTEENYLIAETLIESLNLHDDFKNYSYNQCDKMRAKKSFLESNTFCISKVITEVNELHDKLMILRNFHFFRFDKTKFIRYRKQKAPTQ